MPRKDGTIDAVLIFPPYDWEILDSFWIAPYALANYLNCHGFQAQVWDLNRRYLELLLDRKLLHKEHTLQSEQLTLFSRKPDLDSSYGGIS